jgi:RimJ/RimL family protein N-acetyltransferase
MSNESRDPAASIRNWSPPPKPIGEKLDGRFARLELMSPEHHADALFRANSVDDRIWDFLPYGPFSSVSPYHRWMRDMAGQADPLFYAVYDKSRDAFGGVASYMRIAPEHGAIEVGHINFSPQLQKQPAATEAIYLMMKWAFESGYRRFEWKCDSGNSASRRAAQRFGLSYEGVFRQHLIVKGRNRDTAWFAAIDGEWPALKEAYEAWLSPQNFDSDGRQKERLGDLTQLVRATGDPLI